MSTPLVSIIIPVTGGGDRIDDALHSCISQSLSRIEIICVDAVGVGSRVAQIAHGDSRVRVIPQPQGSSGAEARRVGVFDAAAPYVLFLDVDDELVDGSVAQTQQRAVDSNADIVEFGVAVVPTDDRTDAASHRVVLPRHPLLQDEDIVRQLFPEGVPGDFEIRRCLVRTELLRRAYTALPDGSVPEQRSDLPVAFLACAYATTYASVAAPLYRRTLHLAIGPHTADPVAEFRHALSALDALDTIEPLVRERGRNSPNPEPLLDGFESLRLEVIAEALDHLLRMDDDARAANSALLRSHVDDVDTIAAASTFAPAALREMARNGDRMELGQAPVRSVLLTTNVLTTGGVSGVLRAQAQLLFDAGYRVTIATHRAGSDEHAVPNGATLVQISGSTRHRLMQWAELCRQNEIDVVIDHRILYSRDWPGYALAARSAGAATVGWIHNFAGRPTYNGNDLHSLMQSHLNALAKLIVLSPLDVAFWKLRGIHHTAYLPNPPSPLILGSVGQIAPKSAPTGRRLELVWWGRLEEHTKKVTELVEVAAALKRLGADFRLRIIGPDWADMSAVKLSALASARGLDGFVDVTGPVHGQDLLDAIDSSDIFVNTSIIEGYPLTMPEAQSRGLPVLMYDLPWLSLVRDNPGVITTPQGDAGALAAAIAQLAADPEQYEKTSRASVEAAHGAISHDFATLYQQLVSGTLPAQFSPEPTLDEGRQILDLLIFFAERRIRAQEPSRRRRRRPKKLTLGAHVERRLTSTGHQVLDVAPWLRPVARQVKRALLRL